MIITNIYQGQGLGNQLWLYAVTRSIAENLSVPFGFRGVDNFKGGAFLDLDWGEPVEGDYTPFYELLYYDKQLKYTASMYDERVELLKGRVCLEGLFQSEKYFYGDLARIQRYIRFKPDVLEGYSIDDDTCVLNIRGGEYKKHRNFILPRSYWELAMAQMREHGIHKFAAITDDPAYVKCLLPGVDVLPGGIGDDFCHLHKAKNLILSNSTFPYFAVTSHAHEALIIAPKYFARYNHSANRWASPANVYTGWQYMDRNGVMLSGELIQESLQESEAYYLSKYFLCVDSASIVPFSIKSIVPRRVLLLLKSVLSVFFPRYF